MTRTGSIYALTTPQGTPFYVGRTVQSVGTRAGQHLRDARSGRRHSQVHEILAHAERVGVWVLEANINLGALVLREAYWIGKLESAGFELATYVHSVNGCTHQPPAVRAKLSALAWARQRDGRGCFV